jgi:hypothetical protein
MVTNEKLIAAASEINISSECIVKAFRPINITYKVHAVYIALWALISVTGGSEWLYQILFPLIELLRKVHPGLNMATGVASTNHQMPLFLETLLVSMVVMIFFFKNFLIWSLLYSDRPYKFVMAYIGIKPCSWRAFFLALISFPLLMLTIFSFLALFNFYQPVRMLSAPHVLTTAQMVIWSAMSSGTVMLNMLLFLFLLSTVRLACGVIYKALSF